jgi:hypothetical protein
MSDEAKPKRRGRPPKAEGLRRSGNFTFRLRDNLRAQLVVDAKAHERSISEEIERRVEASYEHEALEAMLRRVVREETHERFRSLVSAIIYAVEKQTGKALGGSEHMILDILDSDAETEARDALAVMADAQH